MIGVHMEENKNSFLVNIYSLNAATATENCLKLTKDMLCNVFRD